MMAGVRVAYGRWHALGGRDLCSQVAFGLQPPLPDVVAMQTRQANLEGSGEIRLRRLVKEALRCALPGSSSERSARRRAWIC